MENLKYHITLSNYFSAQFLFFDRDLQKKPHIRKCGELPFQQTKAGLWDEVTDTLCNLDFIQAKAVAKMTYDLVKDFNDVLEVIPDNAENIRQEKARQARMEKYTNELIACAKGEIRIDELEIPESITPWTREKTDSEIERIKANPTRLDRLKDFLTFIGQETGNLQMYAADLQYFAIQQAWNFADSGPVGEAANISSQKGFLQLILCNHYSRPYWNPFHLVLKILIGHKSPFPITSVSITSDGKNAISGSEDASSVFWELETGRIIYRLINDQTQINSVCMTPDGKWAVSGTSGYYTIWDLTTGMPLKVIIMPSETDCYGGLTGACLTPDCRYALFGSENNTCLLWDTGTGQIVRKLTGHSDGVRAVSITPDCKFAVSGSRDNTCIVWDLKTGQALKVLSGHEKDPFEGINAISMTPDGKFAVSGANDNTVIYWDLQTGEQLKRLKGHRKGVLAVSITPDHKFALSGSMDNNCILWDLISGKPLKILRGHSSDSMTPFSGINSVCITPDAKYGLSCSTDRSCIFWDLESGTEINGSVSNTKTVYKVSITSDGKHVISGSADHDIMVWELETGKTIKHLPVQIISQRSLLNDDKIVPGCTTPDVKFAVLGDKGETCTTWNLESGNPVGKLIGHGGGIHYGRIYDVCVSPDGRYAVTGSNDQTSKYWDLETGQVLRTLNEFYSEVYAVCFTPDGKNAIAGSWFNDCVLWNVKTGKPLNKIKIHNGGIFSLSITPDGKRAVSASGDGTAVLWDLRTWQVLKILKGHSGYLREVKISPDGSRAVTVSGDNTAILWDLKTGKILSRFVGTHSNRTLALYPGGVILDSKTGPALVLKIEKYLLCPGHAIATARYIWNFGNHKFIDPVSDCPVCFYRFRPAGNILNTILGILKSSRINSGDSPCLLLPDEAWEDPGLLGNCPKCGAELKFNPFIAGDS